MGHNIPTFFFPVHEQELQGSELTEEFVQHLLGSKFEARFDEGIREVSSRDWWYQETALELARRLNISGLDFLSGELLILDKADLSSARNSLDQLLAGISSQIMDRGEDPQDMHIGITQLSNVDSSLAFEQSSPAFVINPPIDSGFEAVRGFYSFLKSLSAAIDSALEKDLHLIYYRPQP